jgi:UDP-N-acetyl-D-mannosaminuronic acid transferase (WecB/TagA/CpsF family)
VFILGIDFFDGSPAEAVDCALEKGGLVVAPSGTCFTRLREDALYRRAITEADLAIADSGLMVLLWRLLRGGTITRVSGLAYLKQLLSVPALRQPGVAFWVLPNEEARLKTIEWLRAQNFQVDPDDFYVAPIYGPAAEDAALLTAIEARRPVHVIIGLAGGVQEKLGFYVRENAGAGYRPAIHCIGAALGFITGYQVGIPAWADRLYLGWLLRLLSQPRKFFPRALNAVALPGMIARYGERMPGMKTPH